MHPPDVVDLLQGRWPGHFVCPEGRYVQGDADTGTERRAGIFIGPEFGAVFRPGLVAAAGERMNTDLHMSGDLTNIGKGNLFVIFGEPEIAIIPAQDNGAKAGHVNVNGLGVFHPNIGEIRSDRPDCIACWFIDTDYNKESCSVCHNGRRRRCGTGTTTPMTRHWPAAICCW